MIITGARIVPNENDHVDIELDGAYWFCPECAYEEEVCGRSDVVPGGLWLDL